MNKPDSGTINELLLADIVNISADAVICTDAHQLITLFNEGAVSIFGWTADEVMGQPLGVLLPERLRHEHHRHVDGFGQSTERARRMGERREITGLRKNGEEFPAEAAIARVHVGDSVVYSVVLRDVTAHVALRRRLQRAVAVRDETVGVVAHDLGNPLSAIKMLAKSAIEGAGGNATSGTVLENLELIRSAASQMDALIQNLLDVTRAEAGVLDVDAHPASLADLLATSLETLRPLVTGAGLNLREQAVDPTWMVRADRARVKQVVSNLVGNAVKFTPAGGSITIKATTRNGFAQVSVTDTGSGIPREQLANVFDRFWQAPQPSIRSRGAGLGLAISRGVVLAHGGEIWAESEVGRGSTFHFTLPLADENADRH